MQQRTRCNDLERAKRMKGKYEKQDMDKAGGCTYSKAFALKNDAKGNTVGQIGRHAAGSFRHQARKLLLSISAKMLVSFRLEAMVD